MYYRLSTEIILIEYQLELHCLCLTVLHFRTLENIRCEKEVHREGRLGICL